MTNCNLDYTESNSVYIWQCANHWAHANRLILVLTSYMTNYPFKKVLWKYHGTMMPSDADTMVLRYTVTLEKFGV